MSTSPSSLLEADRFNAAANTYIGGRVSYAPALLKQTAKLVKLGPDSTVLDLD